jgi:hypothetical protein
MKKPPILSQIRTPVRRVGAENYLLLTLLSFAGSISATRLFLELTGYPQLGTGALHIAHVLWGGLLLFIASLLPLVLSNRWAYSASAILSGVGVGLFIDEVGKFITQNNDYFYAPAAPIIYAFFLLTVLLYLQVRRPPPPDPRSELYYVLDAFEEVLDRNLDTRERAELSSRLQNISHRPDQPELSHLANELLDFLASDPLPIIHPQPTWLDRLLSRWQQIENRFLNRLVFRAVLSGGMIALGVNSVIKLIELLAIRWLPAALQQSLQNQIEAGRLTESTLNWFAARIALEGASGLLLLVSAIMLAFGKEKRGLALSYLSLLLSLAVVDLVVFYFDQFSTIMMAIVQFSLLVALLYYRKKYHKRSEPPGAIK